MSEQVCENLRAILRLKNPKELSDTLKSLALDERISHMPAKFRFVMIEAADRLATTLPRPYEKNSEKR